MTITENCTGCMACFNTCPFNAIDIKQDEKGFYVPIINKDKCKKCNKCIKICPQNNKIKKNELLDVYAAWSKNKENRLKSSSGGVFSVIAKKILEKNGVVVGASFDKEFKVVHTIITNKEELEKARGSKYVQSYIGNILKKVKGYLEDGKIVLFSGVPCQIAGLNNFLEKEYPNLITIDILCHGAPSPIIFEEYKKYINFKEDTIKAINFRHKKPSWTVYSMKIEMENDKNYVKDTNKDQYSRAFNEDFITNEVCSECKYIGTNRTGDITLGDFWGYVSESFSKRNTEEGISLVLLNTKKGLNLFKDISDEIIYVKKNISEAIKGNQSLRIHAKKNKNYEEFWECYEKNGLEIALQKYIKERKINNKRRISLLFNNKAYLLPKAIRNKLVKVRNNM